MRRTTKKLGLFAAAAATALLLAGCTPSAGASNNDSGSSKTLTVWHYYSVDGQTAGLDKLGQDFSSNHKGVTVKNVYVPFDQLTNKLVQSAGTGTGPDVVVYNAADTYTLTQAGAIKPMTWWNSYADKDQFPSAVVQKVDDKVMGVQGFVNLIGLWYNKDILDKIGVKAPTTFDELQNDMKLAKAAGYQGITLAGKANSEGEWQSFPWMSRAGFDYKNPSESAAASAYSTMQDWTAKGYLSKEAATWDQTVPFQTFEAGKTAFAVNGNWQIASAKSDAKFTYGVVPIPVGDKGSIYLGGEVQNVGAFSKNKTLAEDYLKQEFFSSKGELTLLDSFGSIPARADAASNAKVKDDPILSVFSDIVAKNGHTSPDPAIPAKNVAKALQLGGEEWSAAIAGTSSPNDIAKDYMSKLDPLLAN